jgi:hypothetical protein
VRLDGLFTPEACLYLLPDHDLSIFLIRTISLDSYIEKLRSLLTKLTMTDSRSIESEAHSISERKHIKSGQVIENLAAEFRFKRIADQWCVLTRHFLVHEPRDHAKCLPLHISHGCDLPLLVPSCFQSLVSDSHSQALTGAPLRGLAILTSLGWVGRFLAPFEFFCGTNILMSRPAAELRMQFLPPCQP